MLETLPRFADPLIRFVSSFGHGFAALNKPCLGTHSHKRLYGGE